MPESWVVRGARERAEAVAEFLGRYARHDMTALPVGAIAKLPDCPIRSLYQERQMAEAEASSFPEDRDYHLANARGAVGTEDHCRRISQALTVAAKRGLVVRVRRGSGPWRYYVPASPN
jgi:hypothetical protein